ncbi:E3 ubiquitin-protein ligase TRIM21-like isoform X2 [Puntigrus tetrazona]|uniref:E3 ubiquitin-protein ligase TRIM21-like isoform X2 n=1 Tax=Puntigrus tetrazona TaxID=1606681 RepID=UPI001C8A0270|nr:E3 ubiquitin-protein ligase TRIM21-like isoform X2 [Puntigrus tetrazona]
MKMMIVKDVEKTRFLSQKDLLTRFNRLSGCQIRDGVYQLVSCMKDGSYLRYNDLGNIEEEILSSSLHRVFTGGECGHQPGLDKYVVALTFDPRTVNEHLYLSENNTKVTRRREKQQLPDNNERFDKCNQVLSRQPLIGRRFFTVDVIGQEVHVGVACKAMQRKGASDAIFLRIRSFMQPSGFRSQTVKSFSGRNHYKCVYSYGLRLTLQNQTEI